MKTLVEPARELPVVREVDVCVVGGGPGGLTAAWQAAKHGAKTLILEAYGFLGGMATAGYVGPMLGLREQGPGEARPTAGGMTQEFCESLAAMDAAPAWADAVERGGVAFDVEAFKLAADRKCAEYGVDMLLHTWAADVIVEDNRVAAVIVESKSGRQAIVAKCFVDATGDADIVYRAGGACTKGRPADGKPMAMGSTFWAAGYGDMTPEQRQTARENIERAINNDEVVTYHGGLGGHGSFLRGDILSHNATRFAGDATDVEDLTRGEIIMREHVWQMVEFWRNNNPGMENAYLVANPPHIGIRETRQIVGTERIVGDDVIAGKRWDSAVARCSYWIDIHCPRGLSKNGIHVCSQQCPNEECYMKQEHLNELPGDLAKSNYPGRRFGELFPPDYFDIPYGSLVPESVENVLVSGRCISADYAAMSATRVMIPCMAIGEACGIAAAMSADKCMAPRNADVAELRRNLVAAGCVV